MWRRSEGAVLLAVVAGIAAAVVGALGFTVADLYAQLAAALPV